MQQTLSGLVTVVMHTLVIYVFLIAALSLLGHRQTSQLGVVELVVIMMLGSAVETSMVAGNTSLLAGLASAAALLLVNRLFSTGLDRWPWLRHFVVGRPIPLIYNGRFLPRRIQAAGLTDDEVLQGLRERGYDNVADVRFAILEIGGSISVVPFAKGQPPEGKAPAGNAAAS